MSSFTSNLDVVSFLVFILSTVLIWWLRQESRGRKFIKTIPGPRLYPIIGNALEIQNPDEFLDKLVEFNKKYGNRVKLATGGYNVLILSDPNDIETILSSQALIAKAKFYKYFIPWLGTGLFTTKGQKWRERRKAYIPMFFHLKFLETFQTIFNEQAQVTVDIMKEKLQSGEDVIQMHTLFMNCTLDIICEAAFGLKLNSQRDCTIAYAEAVAKESEFVFRRMGTPWLQPDILFKYSHLGREEAKNRELMQNFVTQVINDRKRLVKDTCVEISEDEVIYMSSKKTLCGLDMLLQQQANGNKDYDDITIRDEANSIIFGGYDTTSSSLIWTLFLIGTHMDAQKEIQDELDSVFGDDRERPVTPADLAELKYLECVIKESLRIYPPAPVIGRTLEQDVKLDNDTVLPEGLDILIASWVTHRLPEVYPDPLEFRPSRHLPENCKGRHPYAFLPFAAGPRNCMGIKFAYAEDKIILATILRNFHVKALDKSADVIIHPEIIIRPKGGMKFKVTPRE